MTQDTGTTKKDVGKYMTTSNDFIATMKNIPTEEELNLLLRSSLVEVTFTKLDGDLRVMTCTKSYDLIPEDHKPKTEKLGKPGVINVWDVNAHGWRSFHYSRVSLVQPVVV